MNLKTLMPFVLPAIIFLSGCSKDDPNTPADENQTGNANEIFDVEFSYNEIPDEIGSGYFKQVQDAVITNDGKLLCIISNYLYLYSSGNFTNLLGVENSCLSLQIDRNGRIYALGSNRLYISDDNGNTFSKLDNFFNLPGITFFNGYPDHILERKLNDGSYILWAYNEYTYKIGGTGFSQNRYEHFMFTSDDGMNWDWQSGRLNPIGSYPTLIDNNGIIFFKAISTTAGDYSVTETLFRSDDQGLTMQEVENSKVPNAVSWDNTLMQLNYVKHNKGSISDMFLWEDPEWKEYDTNLSDSTIIMQDVVPAKKIRFTTSGHIVAVNVLGVFISQDSF